MADKVQTQSESGQKVANDSRVEVTESGITFSVKLNSSTPRKTDLYYDKDLRLERLLIVNLLAEYVRRGLSVLNPIKCLDANCGPGVNGLLWRKFVPERLADVCIATQHATAVPFIEESAQRNKLPVRVVNKDACSLLHEETFTFIHIDCHATAAHYFDAAFRNLPKNGIFIITTRDDCSLQGRNPSAAFRHYGGYIAKTSYSMELGIRLVIAAMARSAAKYNKALEVLFSVAFKSSFVVAVTVSKGSMKADDSLDKVRRLMHCMVCEHRSFYPDSDDGSIGDNSQMVECFCYDNVKDNDINVVSEFGPLWCGEIFNVDYLAAMIRHEYIPMRKPLNMLIQLLLEEAKVTTFERFAPASPTQNSSNSRKRKLEDRKSPAEEDSENEENPAAFVKYKFNKTVHLQDGRDAEIEYDVQLPRRLHVMPKDGAAIGTTWKRVMTPFYYNLPFHTPKIPHQVPIEKVISTLKVEGYDASRTHFDRDAIRTNATKSELVSIIRKLSVSAFIRTIP